MFGPKHPPAGQTLHHKNRVRLYLYVEYSVLLIFQPLHMVLVHTLLEILVTHMGILSRVALIMIGI